MAEQRSAAMNDGEPEPKQDEHHKNNNNDDDDDGGNNKKKSSSDPDLFCCLLQPATADGDPDYIGIRRLLLRRKAEAGVLRRRVSSIWKFRFIYS